MLKYIVNLLCALDQVVNAHKKLTAYRFTVAPVPARHLHPCASNGARAIPNQHASGVTP